MKEPFVLGRLATMPEMEKTGESKFFLCIVAVKTQFSVPTCSKILFLINIFLVPPEAQCKQYFIFLYFLLNIFLVSVEVHYKECVIFLYLANLNLVNGSCLV
jgi:hypothetical protein